MSRVVQGTKELIKDGWVTKEDGEKIKTEAAHADVP